jgi:hypothetical protein
MNIDKWDKFKIPIIDGTFAPSAASDWLRQVERYHRVSDMTDAEKVRFVEFNLTGHALTWWQGVYDARTRDQGPLTWADFVEHYEARFFPPSFLDQMHNDLTHLQQGNRTVNAYELQFNEIVRFLPTVSRNEKEKIRYFRSGLRPEFRYVLSAVAPTDYLSLVEQARRIEMEMGTTATQKGAAGGPGGAGNGQKRSYAEN